jgi:hypothetical protein
MQVDDLLVMMELSGVKISIFQERLWKMEVMILGLSLLVE